MFWHNRGLMVCFDLFASDFQKSTFLTLVTFQAKMANLKCGRWLFNWNDMHPKLAQYMFEGIFLFDLVSQLINQLRRCLKNFTNSTELKSSSLLGLTLRSWVHTILTRTRANMAEAYSDILTLSRPFRTVRTILDCQDCLRL